MTSKEHDRLVDLAARWLNRNGFPVVATELNCLKSREQPDAIGFRSSCSAIIEAKVSRNDFLADLKKPERHEGGLGIYRFYLTPCGLLDPHEIPAGWGLLEAHGRKIEVIKAPKGNYWPGLDAPRHLIREWGDYQHQPDFEAERSALFSIARRLSQ